MNNIQASTRDLAAHLFKLVAVCLIPFKLSNKVIVLMPLGMVILAAEVWEFRFTIDPVPIEGTLNLSKS